MRLGQNEDLGRLEKEWEFEKISQNLMFLYMIMLCVPSTRDELIVAPGKLVAW